jgi:hypothetical protein
MKFVRKYGKIATPLTSLLKNNAFTWTSIVDHAFQALKYDMCSTLVLALIDFTKTFVLECDASGKGIGAILMQDGTPFSFTRNIWANPFMKRKCYLCCIMWISDILIYWVSNSKSN